MLRLQEALDIFLAAMEGIVSPKTIAFYAKRLPSLITFLGDIPAEEIDIVDLRAWRGFLSRRPLQYTHRKPRSVKDNHLSPNTVHQYVRCVRRLFRWLFLEGLIASNPAQRLELPALPNPRPRGIPLADLEKLYVSAETARDRAIVLFLGDTAARVGGVAGLQLKDLNLSLGQAIVHEKGRGGNGKTRPVFFNERTRQALELYLAERPDIPGCESVFVREKCNRYKPGALTTDGIYQVLKRLARKAGVKANFNPHSFRHGSLRGMLEAGMPLPDVSQIAGHSSVKVTGDIYGVVSDMVLSQRHQKYHRLK